MDIKISDDIIHLGGSDYEIKLFENQYELEKGMGYNSYLIKDEKNVILDTIDRHLTNTWLEKLEKGLNGAKWRKARLFNSITYGARPCL